MKNGIPRLRERTVDALHQSEDPKHTKPNLKRKEEKDKTVEDRKEKTAQVSKEALTLLLKPAAPHHLTLGHKIVP